MKTVYTVHGNHDGILGVYSNMKAAFLEACKYSPDKKSNYNRCTKDLRKYGSFGIYDYENDIFVRIEAFELKSKAVWLLLELAGIKPAGFIG